MKEPAWLTKQVVLLAHAELISVFGGALGLRDDGLLQAALDRPRTLLAYGEPDLFDLAAAFAAGLCRSHPFVDGNKRTAFIAMRLFLRINGTDLDMGQAEAAAMMIDLAAGDLNEEELAVWLRGLSTSTGGHQL